MRITPPSVLTPGQQIPPPKSKWRPIVITLVSAVVLGAGSCFAAMSSSGNWITGVLAAVFLSCVVAFLCGLVWAAGVWIEGLRRGE